MGAIGVFDSGLGGLSVWKELQSLLPEVPLIYYADQLHCPYGGRSEQEVINLSRHASLFLRNQGAELIVVACNTATAAAIQDLRRFFPYPFVGMEPAVKPAAAQSKTGAIGVLATGRTLISRNFQRIRQRYASQVKVMATAGIGLVEAVEQGLWDSPQTEALLRSYVEPMLEHGIDQLVLGCTHYPFLLHLLQKICSPECSIHNPARPVAQQTRRVWEGHSLGSTGSPHLESVFYTTGDPKKMQEVSEQLIPGLGQKGRFLQV